MSEKIAIPPSSSWLLSFPSSSQSVLCSREPPTESENAPRVVPARDFVPGSSPVPISGRVFDEQELELLVESSLDFWLTTGRFAEQFEREFAKFVGVREAVLVNSVSSANLLAV